MAMSSSFVNVDGGTEGVSEVALRVQAAGDDFTQTAQSLAAAIQEIEDRHPWGTNDEYARGFSKNYLATPPGASEPVNDAIKRSLRDAGTTLSQLGTNVVETMAKYEVVDVDGANQISSTQQSA
jgi:hypothetical protein